MDLTRRTTRRRSEDTSAPLDEVKTPLHHWIRDLAIKDEMIWKSAAADQIVTFRDKIALLVGVGVGADHEEPPIGAYVIGTHRSKSIDLPVVLMERLDLGLVFVMRDNFHDIKLSVISDRPIVEDGFEFLFKTTPPPEPDYTGNEIASCYCEGFPNDLVFGYYTNDRRAWTASIAGYERLWTTLFLCMRSNGGLLPQRYHTKESHRRKLDEQSARFNAWREARKTAAK